MADIIISRAELLGPGPEGLEVHIHHGSRPEWLDEMAWVACSVHPGDRFICEPSESEMTLVASLGGAQVGYLTMDLHNEEAWLHMIQVPANLRGQGIGSGLLTAFAEIILRDRTARHAAGAPIDIILAYDTEDRRLGRKLLRLEDEIVEWLEENILDPDCDADLSL